MNTYYTFQWVQSHGEMLVESLKKYDEQALLNGTYVPTKPFQLKKSEGKNIYDVVHYQDVFNFAISEKIYKLLTDARINGWQHYSVNIKEISQPYYGFQVVGKSGPLKRYKKEGFHMGYEFDHETWDGSDFFIPAETLLIFCTEKVRDLFVLNKLTKNIDIKDIALIEHYSV